MSGFLWRVVIALMCAAAVVTLPASSRAQARPDSVPGGRLVTIEYDEATDSTTRSLTVRALVDTTLSPPDTFAVELRQRWRGRDTTPPVAPVDLGIGRTRAEGLRGGHSLFGQVPRPAVAFLLDGARRIRLEQHEYASNAGRVVTFETAWYRLSPAELRRLAASTVLRVRVGDREFWLDPAWQSVVAEIIGAQAPAGVPVRKAETVTSFHKQGSHSERSEESHSTGLEHLGGETLRCARSDIPNLE